MTHALLGQTTKPPTLKRKIAALMSDGRERTYADIASALGVSTFYKRRSMQTACRQMADMGLLKRHVVGGFPSYQRAAQ